jgi:exodeoxyribonuclease-3
MSIAAFPTCRDGSPLRTGLSEGGYHAVWRGERSWNGVAILARKREPVLIRDMLPGIIDDR